MSLKLPISHIDIMILYAFCCSLTFSFVLCACILEPKVAPKPDRQQSDFGEVFESPTSPKSPTTPTSGAQPGL